MFILLKGECETIGTHDKVMVFETHEKAHAEMVRQANAMADDACPDPDDRAEYIDCIDDDSAYIVDVCGWVIFEVPGVLIPDADAQSFRDNIDEMNAIYQDEDRNDWFDGDDKAREIANTLDYYITAAGYEGKE